MTAEAQRGEGLDPLNHTTTTLKISGLESPGLLGSEETPQSSKAYQLLCFSESQLKPQYCCPRTSSQKHGEAGKSATLAEWLRPTGQERAGKTAK